MSVSWWFDSECHSENAADSRQKASGYMWPMCTVDMGLMCCCWLLCSSGPSQLPRPSAHTGAAGPYLQLDDVDETLHSEPDNAQLWSRWADDITKQHVHYCVPVSRVICRPSCSWTKEDESNICLTVLQCQCLPSGPRDYWWGIRNGIWPVEFHSSSL